MQHPYDDFLAHVDTAQPHRSWSSQDGALPPLFLSHGAPPLLEDAQWMEDLFAWARSLPRPRAVLIVSAHWESAPMALSSPQAGTPLVYDFSGFDPRYYQLRYPTPDASALAQLVRATLPRSEDVHEHPSRGLDHGAWVPLLAMYPEADVPVLQLSLPTHDPARLLELGARLRPLREQGVLVVGSGFTTHGLPFLTRAAWAGLEVPGWSREFDAWAAEALGRGDVDELAAFRERAPGMPYAHPTVEHFSPLFVTLGAAQRPDAAVRTTIDGYFFGLARRSVQAA